MISKQERDEEIITNSCFEPSMSLEKKKSSKTGRAGNKRETGTFGRQIDYIANKASRVFFNKRGVRSS